MEQVPCRKGNDNLERHLYKIGVFFRLRKEK